MWGAIIGDIVGSVYEFNSVKTKEFPFFSEHGFYTDDTVCTAAVADILLHNLPVATTLQTWCRKDFDRDYGAMFRAWVQRDEPKPYDSYGNGAAMRVSPAAFLNRRNSLEQALSDADRVTNVTHNHPEGIRGGRATAHAIWLAFQGFDANRIRELIRREYEYNLSRTVDEIRPGYRFDETCQGTVPEAIVCALEASSFEDAVRNAVSLAGDADTLAAIAGPIAEARFGIPADFIEDSKARIVRERPPGANDIVATMERLYSDQ